MIINRIRPIVVLNVTYKLLQRFLYHIKQNISIEKNKPNRGCSDQVIFSNHPHRDQKKLKTSVMFIDLTVAYDAVWRNGLIYKFLQIIFLRATS